MGIYSQQVKSHMPCCSVVESRIGQIWKNYRGWSELNKGMSCIEQLSQKVGELSFQPEQPLVNCDQSLTYVNHVQKLNMIVDPIKQYIPNFDMQTDLRNYKTAVQEVNIAIQSGDLDQLETAIQKLDTAQEKINQSLSMSMLVPPARLQQRIHSLLAILS